jgi:hypothetical protein
MNYFFFFPQPATSWFITGTIFLLLLFKKPFYNSTDDLINGNPVFFFPMVRSMAVADS